MALIIEKITEYFKESSQNFDFILLFGSYADGTFSDMSDIDVGLHFKGAVDYLDIGYHTTMLETLLGKKIEIAALNEIYKKDALFAYNIILNHKVLLMNNEEKYIAFKRKCMLYYFDLKPLFDQNRASLDKRITQNRIGERNFA